MITVGEPEVQERGATTRWSVPLHHSDKFASNSLWFEVPTDQADMLTDRADPALVALTVPAMVAGVDLAFDGPVTDELAFQHTELQSLYAACGFGSPRRVKFGQLAPASQSGGAVLAGFSGGVDSYAMIGDYLCENTPKRLRLTHLLFNNVGSHGDRDPESLWRRRLDRLRPAADALGLPLVAVNSNLHALPGSRDYQVVNSPANAAVGHLLAGAAGTWVFSSSVEYRRVRATHAYNSAFVDPMAMPLMSTGGLQLRLSRSDLRRIDKTRVVAAVPAAWSSLDVCIDETEGRLLNCSRCWKCQMTLAALDLIGAVDRFDAVFDLGAWREDRERYLASARYARQPALVAELGELMDESGYVVPVHLRPRARASAVLEGVKVVSGPVRSRLKGALQKARGAR